MASPFPGPASWSANTTYQGGVDEINAGNGYYYLCTQSGTSGGSAPTWLTTFGTATTDGTTQWACAQRARATWQASTAYQDGGPIQITGKVTGGSNVITNASSTTFVGVGAVIAGGVWLDNSLSPPAYVGCFESAVATAVGASTITVNQAAVESAASNPTTISVSSVYPWADQVVEESGLGLWQCTQSGTSASVAPSWPSSPNWPPNEAPNYYAQPSVTDGTVVWTLVAYNGQ